MGGRVWVCVGVGGVWCGYVRVCRWVCVRFWCRWGFGVGRSV